MRALVSFSAMFTMLPSSSRVKLNRVALKDVVGIRMVPRRKREGRTLGDVTTEPTEQEVTHQQVTATAFDSMEAKKCRVDTQRTKRRRNSHSTKDCTANRERPNTDGKSHRNTQTGNKFTVNTAKVKILV